MSISINDNYMTTGMVNMSGERNYRYNSEGNKITGIVVTATPDFNENKIHINVYKDGEEMNYSQLYTNDSDIRNVDLKQLEEKIKKKVR